MTNTKCRIDCAKYNVKWNIEFRRKWNAIRLGLFSSTNILQIADVALPVVFLLFLPCF